jgi:PAS domain S-box-containing protein
VRLLHELEVHQIELEMQNAELRESRDEVEAALDRYTDLYDFAPVSYFSIDESGLIAEVNLTGADLVGIDRSRLVGLEFRRFVAPASRPAFTTFLSEVFEESQRQGCEVSLRTAGGGVVWADIQATSVESLKGSRRWCRAAVLDITSLKRAEEAQARADALAAKNLELGQEISRRQKLETALTASERHQRALLSESRRMQRQLRQLSHGVLHAQEQERKRVSRELHDEIAQSVLGINIHLEMLSRAASREPAAVKKGIAQTRRLLEDFVEVVHRFSRELRPPVLDDLGLVPALKSYAKDFASQTGIEVEVTAFATPDGLDGDKRAVLFRVAQEALTNVAKHAHAKHVALSVREDPSVVYMEVADDGRAFDVARSLTVTKRRRLGVVGMRERVEMVGGSFSIESTRGIGTRVRARIPLAARRGAAVPGATTSA